jgi:ribonuclease R
MAQWEQAGAHCSANERRADEASRDVEAWLKCRYMREHLGEEYSGTVTAVTSFGVFVTLDALYVEGLVHITELGGEYYRFDEARQELRGERTGLRYTVGARVRVQVSRVDLDGRRIDFRMLREGEGEGERQVTRGRSAGSSRVEQGSPRGTLAEVEAEDRVHKRVAKAAKTSGKGGSPSRKVAAKTAGRRVGVEQPTARRNANPVSKMGKAKVRR